MSLKSEIDRTELSKNNLVTIKNNTNTALTQNGFDNIENFSQLPKALGDVLNNSKKYAQIYMGGSTTSGAIISSNKFVKTLSQKPAFKPEYVFVLFHWTFNIQRPYSGYTFKKDNILISIGSEQKKDACIAFGNESFRFSGKYDYNTNTVEVWFTPEPHYPGARTESLSFSYVYFLG